MPKKTKRQKIQADKRQYVLPVIASVVQSESPRENEELSVIRNDIVKTLVLSIVAIGIECAVYYRFYR